jgi:hypothetical protein
MHTHDQIEKASVELKRFTKPLIAEMGFHTLVSIENSGDDQL